MEKEAHIEVEGMSRKSQVQHRLSSWTMSHAEENVIAKERSDLSNLFSQHNEIASPPSAARNDKCDIVEVGAKQRIEAKRIVCRVARLFSVCFVTQPALAPQDLDTPQCHNCQIQQVGGGFGNCDICPPTPSKG